MNPQGLTLRKFRIADAERVAELVGEHDVSRWTSSIPHPYTIEDAANWINARSQRGSRQALAVDREDTLVGCVSFWPDEDEGIEVGYWVGKPYWGQGIATQALTALFRHSSFPRSEPLTARVMTTNAGSRRVLEKCGFRCIDDCAIERHGALVDAQQYRRPPLDD